jgi:DNA-binding SARP family transcriptional activator
LTHRTAERFLPRSALVDRLIQRSSRCVAITAPAGYGKTVVASQVAARYPSRAVCDCGEVGNLSQFALAVVAALSAHQPARSNSWAGEQLAGIGHPEDLELLAIRAWSSSGPPNIVTFDNAEALCEVAGAGRLIRRLLDAHDRKVLICARRSVDVPLGHGLGPEDFTVAGVSELAFNRGEVRAVAGPASEKDIQRLVALTEGWPVVVGLIARMRKSAELKVVLDELERRPTKELHEYLLSQVLSGLPSRAIETLLTAAVIPRPTIDEVRMAVGPHASDDLEVLTSRLTVTLTDSEVHVHPELTRLLRERYPERARAALRKTAKILEDAGARARAAQIHLILGDQRAAASALQDIGAYLISTPTLAESTVLASLDERVLNAFPRLWCASIVHRGYTMTSDEWLRTALGMWNALDGREDPVTRASVAGAVVNGYMNPGRLAEGRQFLDRFAESLKPDDLNGWGVVTMFGAALDSFVGKFGTIEAATEKLAPLLTASPVSHSMYLYDVIAPLQRLEGRRDLERESLQRAVDLGIGSDMSIHAIVLVEAVFAAWFAGEDDLTAAYLAQLEERVVPGIARGMRFFIASAHGQVHPYGFEIVKARAEGLLMAASLAASRADCIALVGSAIDVADQSSRPFYQVIARLALATLQAGESSTAWDEAERFATLVDPEAPAQALKTLRAGGRGTMFDSFVARFERFVEADDVRLSVLDQTLTIHGKRVDIRDHEFMLLAALAHEPRWFTGAELAADVFGDLDGEAGHNRVYVYFHRLRKAFGCDCVVETSRLGYRLHSTVSVDVKEWSRLFKNLIAKSWRLLHPAERRRLAELAMTLANDGSSRRLPESMERSLRSLRQSTRVAVAAALLEEGNAAAALSISEMMMQEEPESESGYEIAIRVHVRRDDRAAALAQWDHYRSIVRHDLQVEPSDELRRLIQ